MQGQVNALAVEAAPFDTLVARLDYEGSSTHPYRLRLLDGRAPDSSRDLADAIHLICLLHGRHPGVLDYATWRAPDDATRERLELLAGWFDRERLLLTRLVVAVGPIPGTPAQAATDSAVLGQRHALTTLAKSERPGCALGACLALVTDWNAIRPVLDLVAERWLVPRGEHLPVHGECERLVTPLMATTAVRALTFGADQLVAQHRGLWDLLAARAAARAALP